MRYFIALSGQDEIAVDVVKRPGGRREVLIDGEAVDVSLVADDDALNAVVDGHVVDLWADEDNGVVRFATRLERSLAQVESERARIGASASRRGSAGGGNVVAPMPGRVVKVLVAEGEEVPAGGPVVVVEAMKMENELCSERAGRVKRICVEVGQNVEGGTTLVELAPLDEAE